jgi:hypothetical protein
VLGTLDADERAQAGPCWLRIRDSPQVQFWERRLVEPPDGRAGRAGKIWTIKARMVEVQAQPMEVRLRAAGPQARRSGTG